MSEKRFKLKISSFSDDHMKFMNVEDNGKRIKLEEIVDLLNEQQATIRKLQDLCGQSDGENAKLRIENEKLRKENKEMRHELDSLSGCYCADNKEFKDYWRIRYDE